MCTIGVLRLGDEDYLLFKNKDFGRDGFDDRIVVEPEVFAVEGITTWAGSDPALDEFSGFSIGANAEGLLCCDSNVRTLDGHASYDDLVEIALTNGRDVGSGIESVRDAVELRPHLWGNLIMIDASDSAAVEVRGSEIQVVPLSGPSARSNHHVVLGPHPEDDDTLTSQKRLVAAQRRVASVTGIEDIFDLQRAHDDGATGICNHALHQTVYSYVLRHRRGVTTLYVTQGHPCENTTPGEMVLPLRPRWSKRSERRFRASYPSARAINER